MAKVKLDLQRKDFLALRTLAQNHRDALVGNAVQRQLELPTPDTDRRAIEKSPPAPLGDGRGEGPLGI